MAITFPLDLTAETPTSRTFDLIYESGASVSASPFTTQVQTFEHERLHWSAAVTLPPMKDNPDGRRWHSYLINLKGRIGTFYYTVPDHSEPSGTERVNFRMKRDESARTTVFDVRDMTPGATMLQGDLVTIADRLYMIAEDFTADGSGESTATITHGLREATVGSILIRCLNPYGKWRLSSSQATRATDQANIANISFSMVEAI